MTYQISIYVVLCLIIGVLLVDDFRLRSKVRHRNSKGQYRKEGVEGN
jgi:hypothetical protein